MSKKKKDLIQDTEIKKLTVEDLTEDFSYIWRHKQSNDYALMNIVSLSENELTRSSEDFIFNMPKSKHCIRRKKSIKVKSKQDFCDTFNRQLGKDPIKSFYDVWVFNSYKEAEEFMLNDIAEKYEVSQDNFINN